MKMDGFGKFFDQPSCEFGGKYMEVRGGETNTNTNRKKDTNRNYFVTLGGQFYSTPPNILLGGISVGWPLRT